MRYCVVIGQEYVDLIHEIDVINVDFVRVVYFL